MKKTLLVVLLFSVTAFADDAKQCKKDCKEFVELCEKSCDTKLKKKDPRGKTATACKKNCVDFVKQCEKGCDNGEY